MKITPLEIRQHEFEKTFRGYNIEEVDTFLSNLSQEWERVLNESKMLRMQLEIAEKEANKLREIEMTLFKTLKTAEDTSTMITEQANQQADKQLQESKLQGEKLLIEAQQKAAEIVRQAENRAKYVKEEVLGDVKVLERDFRAMDHYKTNLLVQMRSLSNATLEHVQRFEDKFDKEGVDEKFKEATSMLTEEEIPKKVESIIADEPKNEEIIELTASVVEEEIVTEIPNITSESKEAPVVFESLIEEPGNETPIIESVVEIVEPVIEESVITTTTLSSSVNNFIEKEPEIAKKEANKTDELEIIEGIGPKIAMLLFDTGIFTFRDLAITPVYKIQEILEEAGPQFARHDPSTWTQQAKLAAEGRWDDLEALKFYLIGGREPKKEEAVAEPIIATTPEIVPVVIIKPVVEEETPVSTNSFFDNVETIPQKVEEVIAPIIEKVTEPFQTPVVENNLDSITEEMLEKVNKVKAAIRKAMVEKNDAPAKDNSPLPTLNDIVGKSTENSNGGSSFFDNI